MKLTSDDSRIRVRSYQHAALASGLGDCSRQGFSTLDQMNGRERGPKAPPKSLPSCPGADQTSALQRWDVKRAVPIQRLEHGRLEQVRQLQTMEGSALG